VRVRTTPLSGQERIDFVNETASRRDAALSAAEQGALDARRLDPDTLELLARDDVGAIQNVEFTKAFAKSTVNANELGGLIDADGRLSASGAARVKGALVAYAYEEPRLIASLLEANREDAKAIAGGLIEASPAWARMKAASNAGAMDPRADITGNLIAVLELVRRARRDNVPLKSLLGQGDLLTAVEPSTLAMLRTLYSDGDFTRARPAAKIGEDLSFYAEEARRTAPGPSLFGVEGDPAGRILAAIAEGRDRRRPYARNFDADADAARLLDDPAGGAQLDQASGERINARDGSSAGTPILSKNDTEAGIAIPNSAKSTPVAGVQPSGPLQASILAPPSSVLSSLIAIPSTRLGKRSISGRSVMHASDDLEAVYRDLSGAKDSIKQDLLNLVETIDGAEFKSIRLKERGERLEQKLAKRSVSEIGDLLGARIIADSDAAIEAVAAQLTRAGATIIDIDDFRLTGKGPGYRGVHLQVAAGDVSFELQLHPRPVSKVFKEAHNTYEIWRDRTPSTPEEIAQYAADLEQAKKLFDDAWDQWLSAGQGRSKPLTVASQGAPAAKSSQAGLTSRLDPESAKIVEALSRDVRAIDAELREALDDGRITRDEYDAAAASGAVNDPANITAAYDAAAYCLSRSV